MVSRGLPQAVTTVADCASAVIILCTAARMKTAGHSRHASAAEEGERSRLSGLRLLCPDCRVRVHAGRCDESCEAAAFYGPSRLPRFEYLLQPGQPSCMRSRLKSVGLESSEYLQQPGALSLCRKSSWNSRGYSKYRGFIRRQCPPASAPSLDLGPEPATTPQDFRLRLNAV